MNVVITGASNGIGFQCALQLLKEGHTVFALARSRSNLEKLMSASDKTEGKLHQLPGSITDPEFLKKVTEEISKKAPALHALVNNAGLLINKPFETITAAEWSAVYQTNVFGPAQLIQAFLPLLQSGAKDAGSRSHIINISSMGGFQGSQKFKGLSAYSSSKAALAVLTECLAEEFRDMNIAVNCLCLGSVQTEMFSQAFPQFTAAVSAEEMGAYIARFATEGQKFFNGKVLPVSSSTP